MNPNKKKPDHVCLCNQITRASIESAIRGGADTLNKIYDCTQAGVGPCGGSCRRKLAPMLDAFLETGVFPAAPISPTATKHKKEA
jgi:bacterioferritin-associated ferredoxin